MGKKATILWSVRLEADLYEWLQEVMRREPNKPFLTAQYVANEALRDYRDKMARTPGRRTDAEILAAKDAVIAEHDARLKRRTRKPK